MNVEVIIFFSNLMNFGINLGDGVGKQIIFFLTVLFIALLRNYEFK